MGSRSEFGQETPSSREEVVAAAKSFVKRRGIFGVVIAAGLVTLPQSFFTVDPTDVAFVRHFDGSISETMYTSGGLHLKWPFLDTVDRLQYSENQIVIPEITVNATDDPGIKVKVTLNAEIKKENLYATARHLLYELGRPGNVDIKENIIPVASSYVLQTLAAGKATALTTDLGTTQAKLQTNLNNTLEARFGITVKNFNISGIDLGEAYIKSSQRAVAASNEALQAQYAGEKTVTEAAAEANKKIQEARGNAESTVMQSKANLDAARNNADAKALEGEGEQRRTEAVIKAFGGVGNYLTFSMIQKWGGGVAQVNGGGASTVLLPSLPALAAPSQAPNAYLPK